MRRKGAVPAHCLCKALTPVVASQQQKLFARLRREEEPYEGPHGVENAVDGRDVNLDFGIEREEQSQNGMHGHGQPQAYRKPIGPPFPPRRQS